MQESIEEVTGNYAFPTTDEIKIEPDDNDECDNDKLDLLKIFACQVDDQSIAKSIVEIITKVETMKLNTLKQKNIADYFIQY